MKKLFLICASLFLLNSCGGGGGSPGTCIGSAAVCFPGSASSNQSSSENLSTTIPGVSTLPLSSLANVCTPEGEKTWIRKHLDDVYLWYQEIVDVPPGLYSSPVDYFYALLVRSKDRFSFVQSKSSIDGFFEAGQEVSYGAVWLVSNNRLRVSFTEANSSAAEKNIQRGAEIVAINGRPFSQLSSSERINAMYPSTAGTAIELDVLDLGATATRKVQLVATTVTKSPVLKTSVINTADNKKVGYMVFNDHIAPAEAQLISAVTQFQQTGIDDLVLDVRYNGGGYLYIASQLAYMIGGTNVQDKTFEKLVFNAKHPEKTNDPDNQLTFLPISSGSTFLPQLNLKRVFVLTSSNTCSASESIINGLSPFVQVITIGGTTCGKPYGFRQKDNCDKAYFAIEFEGVNNSGQGGYVNGFAPTCPAADDLEHQLGDTSERLLATALGYRTTNSCPAIAGSQAQQRLSSAPTILYRPPAQENRLLK